MPATSAWAGAPPSGANGQGWIPASHQTRSLRTHGALAPVECQFTFYAWAAPGSVYPFHCHILAHVMNPGQSMDEMGGLITLVVYDK